MRGHCLPRIGTGRYTSFFSRDAPPLSFYSLSGSPLSRVGREGGAWRWLEERGERRGGKRRLRMACCSIYRWGGGHSWARTPRILRAKGGGGLLHKVRTLLQWDPEARGGVHNPDPMRAQVW